jgi:hypothetical protein
VNRRTRCALAVSAVLFLATGTACEQKTFPPGPTGKVADRSSAYFKSGGWRFWLTVDGTKFRVSRADYRGCVRGSAYPACTNR